LMRRGKWKRKNNAEYAQGAEFAEKWGDVAAGCETVHWLPGSLRCVTGAPRTARKKKPATPVGMTEQEKHKIKKKSHPENRRVRHPRRAGPPEGGGYSGAAMPRDFILR
jgi:hypothetical protein